MKKNAMLKIAAGLMVAVLLTTCAISSTFAKYTAEGEDGTPVSANVAKWKLTIETEGEGVFAESYNSGKVQSLTSGTDVIAPGTTKSGTFTASISGISEVAFEIIPTVEVNIANMGTADCPLVFTVGSNTYQIGTKPGDAPDTANYYATNAALVSALQTAIADATKVDGEYKTFQPGDFTSAPATAEVTVGWSWPWLETDAANTADTALGNAAAEGSMPSVTVTVSFDAAQIN